MNQTITIGGAKVGLEHPPFVIAEMSGNHNQSLNRALELVDAAADSGASALKLQTYTAETITLNVRKGDFQIKDKNSLWSGENLYDLYNKAHTPWEWHAQIFDRCRQRNIICFSSPFDESAIDFLEELNAPAYKIASFENNHLPLIYKAATTGKPLIISTGMATIGDIEQAVATAREGGFQDLILLKCTSTYPASPENSNIRTIPHLSKSFKCQVGISDHTMGTGVAVAAVALGATVIEKHFTLSRSDGGVDSTFSLEPKELSQLTVEAHRAWKSLGEVTYGPSDAEAGSLQFKRSIYVSKDIRAGELFSEKNLRIVRPGHGAPPHLLKAIVGKHARRDFAQGEPLTLDSLL